LQIPESFKSIVSIAVLPHGDSAIDKQNQKNYKWFDKSSDTLLTVASDRE